jgi:UDP-GlcNAc:undecaprenyl-phosphate/decaprenyl-phosphate GlcNAc-1-phosphate transferase
MDSWPSLSKLLFPALAALAAAVVLTLAIRWVARRLGIVARPDEVRRFHPAPVPLLGGVAVYLALVVGSLAALVAFPDSAELKNLCVALIPAAGLACLFGAVDDRYNLGSRPKLALQLLAVTPIVAAGCQVDFVVVFGCRIELGWLGMPLTVLWLLGCINALNLIDGMDGLASVVGLSTAAMMAVLAISTGNPHVTVLAVVLAAALCGFLIFNLPPASVFLGDSGSAVLGLVIGILGIAGSIKSSATLIVTAPAVMMTLPMFDVLMAMVRRKLTGRPLDAGDHEHIHHRLLERGFGPWQVLCLVGAICLTTGAAATAATLFRADAVGWITATTLVVLMIQFRLFGHHEWGLLRSSLRRQAADLARRLVRGRAVTLRLRRPPAAERGKEARHDGKITIPSSGERRKAA